MFRSLLYDHPQGSFFVLSALPLLRLLASSSCLSGMWLYFVYVCAPGVPVCGLSGRKLSGQFTTRQPTDRYTGHTHTHIDNIQPHTE
jgi:hypothetical protein